MQCGFKEKGSTNMCSFMVKETIQYYLQNSSNVHADTTKAFDIINVECGCGVRMWMSSVDVECGSIMDVDQLGMWKKHGCGSIMNVDRSWM